MIKKEEPKIGKTNSKVKKGTKYACASCGMVLVVDRACSCDRCDIICCGEDMKVLA